MRILTLVFESPAEFLSAYSEKQGGALLFARTKTEGAVGDSLLVELSMPGLPNRALLRANVTEPKPGEGLLLAIDPADASTRDFILGIARGAIQVSFVERSHGRYPAALPVVYRTGGANTGEQSTLVDLSTGGAFIRAEKSPEVGTPVAISIELEEGAPITVPGHVTWIGVNEGQSGFGVDFEMPIGEDGRRLRLLLRNAEETGKVGFAPSPRPR